MITIAAELVSAQKGVGALFWMDGLRTEELYASLMVTAILGISLSALVQFVTGRQLSVDS